MRDFEVTAPAVLAAGAPGELGRLGGALRRLAAQQGRWPPVAPRQVARVPSHPAQPRAASTGDPARPSTGEALELGAVTADRLVDSGADLVVVAGGGERTPALVLLAALLDRDPVGVTGTTAAPGWATLVADVRDGLRASRPHLADPGALLDAARAVEAAELTGLLLQCAVRRTPVLLSAAADVWAAALVAQRIAPTVDGWLIAGCSPRSPVTALAIGELRLSPLLDLEIDLPAAAELALGVLVGAVGLAAAHA